MQALQKLSFGNQDEEIDATLIFVHMELKPAGD